MWGEETGVVHILGQVFQLADLALSAPTVSSTKSSINAMEYHWLFGTFLSIGLKKGRRVALQIH